MMAVGVVTLRTLGMPLPTWEAIAGIKSIATFSSALFPTITKGVGLLGAHGGYVTAISFLGGLGLSQMALNAYGAIRDRNMFGRDGFLHNTARTARNVVSGTIGMLVGTYAGAKLSTLFSSMAASVHDTGAIFKNFYNMKFTGITTPPVLTPNFNFESGAKAALENMQQGWSIFWQGIGTSVSNPDFAAAMTVLLVAATTAAAVMHPVQATKLVRRTLGYRPS
jgi:hypothetical protein